MSVTKRTRQSAVKWCLLENPRRTLNDSVHGTRFLTESAVDALGHVNVVAGRAAGAVSALLSLDGDGLRRADGLAQLAGNAALFASRVAAQGVLTTEAGRDGALLEGVENCVTGM